MTALPEFHTVAVKQAREHVDQARKHAAECGKLLDELDQILAKQTA